MPEDENQIRTDKLLRPDGVERNLSEGQKGVGLGPITPSNEVAPANNNFAQAPQPTENRPTKD